MMLGFGIIWMLLFWGGLIALAVWLVGKLFPGQSQADDRSLNQPVTGSAIDILNTRYARGELTTEQYQEMLKTLKG